VLVLAGALGHLLTERTKRIQDSSSGQIVVVGDLLRWLHLRWAGICLSIAWVAVTAVVLKVTDQDSTVTAIAAGYASDSFAGLFIGRFADIAGTRVTALKTALGLASSTPAASPGAGGATGGGGGT
jgi:hypothetical protein